MGKGLDENWSYAPSMVEEPGVTSKDRRDELQRQMDEFYANREPSESAGSSEGHIRPYAGVKARVIALGRNGKLNYALIEMQNGRQVACSYKKDFADAVSNASKELSLSHIFYLDRTMPSAGTTKNTRSHSGKVHPIQYYMCKAPRLGEPD